MNILVTGASGGIGGAICEELHMIGNVYATGRNLSALKSLDVTDFFVCDLSCDIKSLTDFIGKNNIDVLINNAGEYLYSEIENLSCSDTERLYKVNLAAPTELISAVVPNMKNKKWGRIINIGSISGVMGEACASVYSASKAGLIGLTKALALELAEYNITVNTINPGWVDTKLGKESIEDSDFSEEEILSLIPQKRFVAPSEVASLVSFLISEEAKGITGQSINLCAGLSVGY